MIYDNQLQGQPELANGQALLVLFPRLVHVVSSGETLEELVPPRTNEEWMLQEARRFGVEPVLVLTPFAEPDVFNNQLVKAVVEDT